MDDGGLSESYPRLSLDIDVGKVYSMWGRGKFEYGVKLSQRDRLSES
jgi:hypothetical protein